MKTLIPHHTKPLIKYASIGTIVTLLNFGLMTFFIELLYFNKTLSSGLAYFLSTIFNYILQYRYTFRSTRSHQKALTTYAIISVLALMINTALFWALNSQAGVPWLYAQFVTMTFVFLLNFILHRRFTFANG